MTRKSLPADDVLCEVRHVRQVAGEHHRRWYSASGMDLVVWHDGAGALAAFQLCYDKNHRERALTWTAGQPRLVHMAVDDGETWPLNYKSTPILVPESEWSPADVLARFRHARRNLPVPLADFIEQALQFS